MSDFLEHKKVVDPAAWMAQVPEKWRLPLALGGPALVIIVMLPLLFRDDHAKPIDTNTVQTLSQTARTETQTRMQRESALDAALARKLAADQQQLAQPAPAAATKAAPAEAAASAAASAVPIPKDVPQTDPNARSLQPAGQTQQAQALKTGTPGAGGGAGSAGGAAAAAPAPAPKAQPAPAQQVAALGPPPKLSLRPFDWKGAGAGAGKQILSGSGGRMVSSGADLAGSANGSTGSSAFQPGAGAYAASGGAGAGGAPTSASGGMGHSGGSSAGAMGGGGGAFSQAPVDTSGANKLLKQCKDAQDKYKPQLDEQNGVINNAEKYRSDHSCKNIGCFQCNGDQWNITFPPYRQYYCPCGANRCKAQAACRQVNQLQQDWKNACPVMGNVQAMDCNQT